MTPAQTRPDHVVIERTFDAPPELVWLMWTDPEHFKAWYGPAGATIPQATIDARPGGTRLVCMEIQTPAGPRQMWFTGKHREVVPNSRLVYTEAIAGEDGRILSPAELGMPDDHPPITEITVELQESDGRTSMVVTHAGIPADSPGASGWTAAFEKLATYLQAHAAT